MEKKISIFRMLKTALHGEPSRSWVFIFKVDLSENMTSLKENPQTNKVNTTGAGLSDTSQGL